MSKVENVGIVAAEVYFPSSFVSQNELEKFDRVSEGKYTKGLGQINMAFCGDREDINSICLTVVHNLLEKYQIPLDQIGRLEVGTETLLDKSKSVKSTLMTLFQESGNTDIEGVDTINACYGGTNALFNSINWVESSSWDGRYALVVAGDIAVYEPGPARPTGGAGVVAMLIGPNAPISIEPGLRSTHMEHAFDFYKPRMESEYPRVDGKLSNSCYIRALDSCYSRFSKRYQQKFQTPFNVSQFDYAIFHQPYQKLVQKSFARYFFHDYLVNPQATSPFAAFKDVTLDNTYDNRDVEKAALAESANIYKEKVEPSTFLGNELGNSYCGSLYAGLVSLIHQKAETLPGKRILMFSYGSGLAASMFMLNVNSSLQDMKEKLDLENRLKKRISATPEEFTTALTQREQQYNAANYTPTNPVEKLFPGTYYLTSVDHLERRSYARLPTGARAYHTLLRKDSNSLSKRTTRPFPSLTPRPSVLSTSSLSFAKMLRMIPK